MADRSRRTAPAWDPAVTIGLLIVGVIRVTETVATARSLDAALAELFRTQGFGEYTSGDVARGAGVVVIVVSLVCLVLAIGFSVPRIRARRRSFWIPLVCAAIWLVVVLLVVVAAVVADPAFLEAAMRRA